jgi:SsrA-binding protein
MQKEKQPHYTMKKKPNNKKVIENRKASFNYEQLDDLEVGMALTGNEVKAIRAGHMQLTGSYGRLLQGPKQPELWLVGATISSGETDKQRSIKLLAHRGEIARLIGATQQKGLTLVPKKIYFKQNRAKLLLTISRGKKLHEKRQTMRERDMNRDIARELRSK